MIVVDASVLGAALADDDVDGASARRRLVGDGEVVVPDLVDAEVVAILRRAARNGSVSPERAAQALDDLGELPVRRVPTHRITRALWHLGDRFGPADAAYLALAGALDVVLLTADRRLAGLERAPCRIEVLS